MQPNEVIKVIEEAISQLEAKMTRLDEERAKLADEIKRHKRMLKIARNEDAQPVAQGAA